MTNAPSPPSTNRRADAVRILLRLSVGTIFVSEGIQKFLHPADIGAGRFAKMGFPAGEVLGPFVAVVEIACGALVLLGLFTRVAAVPLIGVMTVALITTKLPILLGADLGPFQVRQLPRYGLWSMLHEARTDISMFLTAVYLAFAGGGAWSLDRLLHHHPPPSHEQP